MGTSQAVANPLCLDKSMVNEHITLREDDPQRADLEAQGYTIVGQSWGARLEISDPPDLSVFEQAVSRVQAAGIRISELPVASSSDLQILEEANNADYPFTPATSQEHLDEAAARDLWNDGFRVFGAFVNGQLVGATVIKHRHDRAETEFTSVLRSHRGCGIGAAVKAASVIACVNDGARLFGTGGAAVNEASLGVNRAIGYQITERWFSYETPRLGGSSELAAGPQ